MAAGASGPKSPFDNLPRAVVEEVSAFLPAEDIPAFSQVAKSVFDNISKSPSLWTRVAKKLHVKIEHIKDPKQDVLAYYKESNEKLLQFFAGFNLPREADPFLQRRIIENALKDFVEHGPPPDEEMLEIIEKEVAMGNIELVRLLLEADFPLNRDHLFRASAVGHTEMVKLFIESNTPMVIDCLFFAIGNQHIDVVKLLIGAKLHLDERSLDCAILAGKKPTQIEIVKLLIAAKAPIPANAVQLAESKGLHEIAALLRAALEGAEAPKTRSGFDDFPLIVQEAASTFLPPNQGYQRSPSLWERVARMLNERVGAKIKHIDDEEQEKQNVLAYYKSSNDKFLEFFNKRGLNIQAEEDPFLQRRLIENAVKEYVAHGLHSDDEKLMQEVASEVERGNIEHIHALIESGSLK